MKMSTTFDNVFKERFNPTEGSGEKSKSVVPVMISALSERLGSQKSKVNNIVNDNDRSAAYIIDIEPVLR